MLDGKIRLCHRRGGCFRGGRRSGGSARGGQLAFRARQGFGGIAIHRIGVEETAQPFHRLVVLSSAFGELGQAAQRDDVFPVEVQDLFKDIVGGGVVLLIDQAPGIDDVGTDIIGVQLETFLTQANRVI